VKVIFDHNLSPRLARALHAFFSGEHEVISLRDRFDPAIKDVDLIRILSAEGNWVFISGDRRITRNKAEREVFRNSRLIGLFMSSGLYKARDQEARALACSLGDDGESGFSCAAWRNV